MKSWFCFSCSYSRRFDTKGGEDESDDGFGGKAVVGSKATDLDAFEDECGSSLLPSLPTLTRYYFFLLLDMEPWISTQLLASGTCCSKGLRFAPFSRLFSFHLFVFLFSRLRFLSRPSDILSTCFFFQCEQGDSSNQMFLVLSQ